MSKKHPWTPEDKEECRRLYLAEGKNRYEIAKIMHRSVHDCHGMMLTIYRETHERQVHVLSCQHKRSDAEIAVRELMDIGWPCKRIAEKLGIPLEKVEGLANDGIRGTINVKAGEGEYV